MQNFDAINYFVYKIGISNPLASHLLSSIIFFDTWQTSPWHPNALEIYYLGILYMLYVSMLLAAT